MIKNFIILLRSFFLALILLWSVDGVNSDDAVPPGTDTVDDVNGGQDDFPSIVNVLNNVTSNTIIILKTDVLSSKVTLEGFNSITITGQGNSTVSCNDIGSVKFVSCKNVTIKDVNWKRCGSVNNPGMEFYNTSNIAIRSCSFHHSTGKAVALSKVSGNVSINNCEFTHNKHHKGHGAAIYYTSSHEQSTELVINNCTFTLNGPAESVVYIDNSHNRVNGNISFLQNSTFTQNRGVPFYISHTSLTLNNFVLFEDNKGTAGGAIFSSNSTIEFYDKCKVSFYNNSADDGGAIYQNNSKLFFRSDTLVIFDSNVAADGGAIYQNNSKLFFRSDTLVIFDSNIAADGGAIYQTNSKLFFRGHTSVIFDRNIATDGGAIYQTNSELFFKNDTLVSFDSNIAADGGAIYQHNSMMLFSTNSTVLFISNVAADGGAIYQNNSKVIFSSSTTVIFTRNVASHPNSSRFYNQWWISGLGGAVYSESHSLISFEGSSMVAFNENRAGHGGALGTFYYSNITFCGYSMVSFVNNSASLTGGAVHVSTSSITLCEHSVVRFNGNHAAYGGAIGTSFGSPRAMFTDFTNATFVNNNAIDGGAVYLSTNSLIVFTRNVFVMFCTNTASMSGSAISSSDDSSVWFAGKSVVYFNNNVAKQHGGAIASVKYSRLKFSEGCSVNFTHNTAMQHGGAVYLHDNSSISFVDNATSFFGHNMAENDGGALYSYDHCKITIGQYSEVIFVDNSAMQCGGAMYCDRHSDVTLEGTVTFTSNIAKHGGAVCVSQSIMKFTNNSAVELSNNRATGNGGGLYFTDKFKAIFNHGSSIKFNHNTAYQNGGALYCLLNHQGLNLKSAGVAFTKNRALTGEGFYLDIGKQCNETCLNWNIAGSNKEILSHIYTPPSKLVLHNPAVCIDDDNVTNCGKYFVSDIMLGQEIVIDACVLDYFNQPADETQIMVDSNDEDHTIIGTNSVLISCTRLQGISVKGSKIFEATNFTTNFTFHSGSQFDLKMISIELVIDLSPCYPGFYYDNITQRCVCYCDSNFIYCSGETAFIRRGYWFGVVSDKVTVAVCPNHYCNFEIFDKFYELSPVRRNQCSSHRSGAACGSCEEGYTLSFDSVECVSVDKCTTGQAVVVPLSIIYWIGIVLLVLTVTYYHVGIDHFYAITYYYSILDILLSQRLYQSKQLFTVVTTMSSFVKITPQFLGQFCLVVGMSGIDQQFIHYTHPLAVSGVMVIIYPAARISHKFSSFMERGVIQIICFLLLLSYTSVASTSLLLLRSLTFDNLDEVYTYLSPDIGYCHGRHILYFIVAVLFIIVIVIGLPILLLLEPFLNHKINFTRMKPLLYSFQECYKDKYHCFAAYYMICRLIIIVIIISIPSSNDLSQFLITFSCSALAFMPVLFKPYSKNIINCFDGLILQLVVLVTLIPLADNVSQQLSTATIIVVILLPLILFIALEMILHKETIKNTVTKISAFHRNKSAPAANDNNNVQMGDIDDDNNARQNSITYEM